MVVEVEIGVLDPHGMVDPERNLNEPPAQRRDGGEPAGDVVAQACGGETPASGLRLEDHHARHVHGHGG